MNSKQPLLEEIQTVDHNNYWISLVYKKYTIISIFYTNGIKSNILMKEGNGWVEIELKEEEKKGVDEFIDRRENGGVRYKRVRGVVICRFEEFTRDKMIEYDMNGDRVYEGRCEGDIGNGFYRSGYGCEYKNGEKVYDGNWVLNKRQGQGKCYIDGKVYYDGIWYNNSANGYGKSYVNGRIYYEGNWQDGLPHEYGEMTDDQGKIIKGNWQNGYLQIGNKIYYYESEDDNDLTSYDILLCSVAVVGIVSLFTGPLLNQLISPLENFYYLFVFIGAFCFLLFCLLLFSDLCVLIITMLIMVVYCSRVIFFIIMIFIELEAVFAIYSILAAYALVASLFVFDRRVKNSSSNNTLLNAIFDKKSLYCIIIEFCISIIIIIAYYSLFWDYDNVDWKGDRFTDLRYYGLVIVIDGLVYVCTAILHCCEGKLFTIGNWVGIIWGIASTVGFALFYLYFDKIWISQNLCPKYDPYLYPCEDMRRYLSLIAKITWISIVTSLILHVSNRDKIDESFENKEEKEEIELA